MPQIKLIRAYDQAAVKRASGYKILVDRLWPRGLAKADLPYQWWLKELAPSSELRKWFNHQEERYPECKQRYLDEIAANPLSAAVLDFISLCLQSEDVILIYGAKNEQHNQAVVLKAWLEQKLE